MEKVNNEMIKELANTLEYLCFADTTYDEDDELIPNYKGIAEELINVQGYLKLPKDSVVLSREEYGSKLQDAYDNGVEFGKEWGSKKTAEKIYTFVNSFGTHNWERFEEFIKQFGVEIKEN